MINPEPYEGKKVFIQLRQDCLVLRSDPNGVPTVLAVETDGPRGKALVPMAVPFLVGTLFMRSENTFAVEHKDPNGCTLETMLNADIVASVSVVTDFVEPPKPAEKSTIILGGR